jgi:hypothetical protein
MTKKERLIVVARDGEIVVSVAGFKAVYYKPTNQPELILWRRSDTDDHELLARAWQAANDKAPAIRTLVPTNRAPTRKPGMDRVNDEGPHLRRKAMVPSAE